MSSINGEEAVSSLVDAPTVAMDTEQVVGTDRGEGGCHGDGCGGDGNEEEDAMSMAMLVVTVTSKDHSPSGIINPVLLSSARLGAWVALNVLLEREDEGGAPRMTVTQELLELVARGRNAKKRSSASSATRDVEVGFDLNHQPCPFAARTLLKGVTPDGDSVLHVAASNGDGENFLKYASIIYDTDIGLLFAKNHRGETPLHCAARAGNIKMASHLIDLAGNNGGPDKKLTLLRMENRRHETALHEAVRFEDGRILGPKDREALLDAHGATKEDTTSIVKLLMRADPELADFPAEGISPLYLAILLEKSSIALTLYDLSGGNLSYAGADGQNALHLAVLRDKETEIVKCLLSWNMSLAAQVDNDGNTPLHFASSIYFWSGSYLLLQPHRRPPWFRFVWFQWRSTHSFPIVFDANRAALHQADKNGLFPIHVAASVGALGIIRFFIHRFRDSAGLRNAEGRTFLHVAVEKRKLGIVSYVCGDPSLAWILNMQDNDGNTALHLAIQAGSFRMFCALLGNRKVNLNISNNQGETPRDISVSKIPRGLSYSGNSENRIRYALWSVRANHGALRWDKIEEKYFPSKKPENEEKESERLKDASQTLVIATVLIATMAFSATFALPGGYRADDHTNAGTPTLAGGYVFDTFIMATSLAFICSLLATTCFMFAGIPMVNLITRRFYTIKAMFFISGSVTCLSIAFALGVYMVLAPVAPSTAVVVCVITPAILVGKDMGFLLKMVILARPLCIRKGIFPGMVHLLVWCICQMLALWPFLVIFGWGGLARNHHSR